MKKLLTFCFLFVAFSMCAQKSSNAEVRSPLIVCKVKLGQYAGFENQSVQFVKVISDSRCPKNVTCVWAGEAKILVNIYEDKKLIESREITIAARKGNKIIPLLSLKNDQVGVYSLDPYPDAKTPEANKDYVLNLVVADELKQEIQHLETQEINEK